MKKSLQIALICFILAGCGSTLKQGWSDFTAYYNTFYNAKQFYDAGLTANQRQIPPINPNKPIRVHPSPTAAGHDDFSEAIERASSILRDHQQSRYVNPAVAKIGKSYFYRTEYFSALEKFQELQTLGDEREQQEAILWQGRTYLEMANYAEGIQFLEIELDLREEWDPIIKSEIGLVLTQLFVEQGNWESSLQYIQSSIDGVEDRKLKSRGYFLFGQILEEFGRYSNAVIAYRQIRDFRPDFDLEYNALKKEAEVSRKMGNYDRAVELFSNLERSDKFIDYRMDLQFELAQTHQLAGNRERAMQLYHNILAEQFQTPDATVRARTYYGLAEIYRFQKDDFQLAAAYYDSAATERADESLLPDDFQAAELAESFGEYAEIKQQIAHNDSLLHLATLERAELDSVIAEIQQRKMEEMERQERELRRQQQQAVNVEEPDELLEAAETTEHGFLNINNPARIAEASLQFQSFWGDRPLADNWRRRADVSGSRHDQFVIRDVDDGEVEIEPEDEQLVVQAGVDVEEIPFSEAEREEMRIANEELYYRLGNLFFLSLDMPDNAREAFNWVLNSNLNPNLTSRTYYTLAEIELAQDNREEAETWFERLRSEFPNTIYTERIADRLGAEIEREEEEDSVNIQRMYANIKNSDLSPEQLAKELQNLAYKADREDQRSEILFDAAKEYAKAAQQEHQSNFGLSEWTQKQEEIEQERSRFNALQDSARVMLGDTTLAEEEAEYWQQISDSTFAEPDLMSEFPFQGTYWDSTRSVLNYIESYYASSKVMPRVQILKQTIEKPSTPVEEEQPDEAAEDPEDTGDAEVMQCSDLGIRVNIDGGKDAFMDSVSFPSWTQEISMRGELTYLFTVEPDGSVSGYEQVSRMDRSGIPQAVENAIERLLQFNATGSDTPVECTETFPIDL